MPAERDQAQTQPLPVAVEPRRARCAYLRPLARYGTTAFTLGVAGFVAEYAPLAARAPRIARGIVWALCCGSLALGLIALTCCTVIAMITAVMTAVRTTERATGEQRRALYSSSAPQLKLYRDRTLNLAALAANIHDSRPPAGGQEQPGLHVVGSQRRAERRN